MESHDGSFAPAGIFLSESPNPLRPYHRDSLRLSLPPTPPNGSSAPAPRRPAASSASSLSDIFPDIDYGDYVSGDSPSLADMAKRLVDRSIWNYTSVVMAHPFEVAKIVLQCYDASSRPVDVGTPNGTRTVRPEYAYSDSEDSDSDAPSYFAPTSPDETPSRRRQRPGYNSRSSSSVQSQNQNNLIVLQSPDSILEVIGQIWNKEGAFGIWKGTNSTFVHGILLKTIETWTRGFLSAILNIPDPTLLSTGFGPRPISGPSILDSASPFTSLSVVVIAAGVAGCLLYPIDIVRTRLILTPNSAGPRNLLPSLRALPTLSCPPELLPITILHSTLPTLFSTSMPLFIRNWFRIDPVETPSAYSVSAFLVALGDLFIKLPLETVLRRGHVAYLSQITESPLSPTLPLHTAGLGKNKFRTIIAVGQYRGIVGTMLTIVHEEGYREALVHTSRKQIEKRTKRGQGLKGLWRGWRVGFWALVGMWTAMGVSAGSSSGGEL